VAPKHLLARKRRHAPAPDQLSTSAQPFHDYPSRNTWFDDIFCLDHDQLGCQGKHERPLGWAGDADCQLKRTGFQNLSKSGIVHPADLDYATEKGVA
jgi:hypothetical protein